MADDKAFSRLPTAAASGQAARNPEACVPKTLNGKAKAAVVVRLLLSEGTDLPLEALPEDLQARLTQQMGEMGLIDRITLSSVVGEFVDALNGVGLAFPKGLAGALSVLDGKISPQTAARLRKEAGVRQAGDPWVRLRALPTDELANMVRAESTEVAAVLLSKLDVGKAAELLGQLPGPLARRITYAVSLTGKVTPDAVDRIGLSLASQLDSRPLTAFDDAPGERLGAILNQSPAATRDEMLAGLDETDAEFARKVRKAIFTFAHIPTRVAKSDVPKLIRAVEPATLVTALKAADSGAEAETAEYILSSISSRIAESLREEIAEKGKVKTSDGETAMTAVVAATRSLVEAGEIALILPDADEDPD